MWEYKTETYAGNWHYTRGRLNEDRASLDRWEAIALNFTGDYTIVMFKRQIVDEPVPLMLPSKGE